MVSDARYSLSNVAENIILTKLCGLMFSSYKPDLDNFSKTKTISTYSPILKITNISMLSSLNLHSYTSQKHS